MPDNKDKGIVDFSPDPEYASRIASAKQKVPVGGVPMPKIPRLDQPLPDPSIGVQSQRMRHAMLSPEQQEELQKRGQFIPGVGSGYAANQPSLRTQAPQPPSPPPPISNGNQEYVNPPRPAGAGLRQETVEQLQNLAQAQASSAQPAPDSDEELKKEIDDLESQFDTDEFGQKVRNLLNNKERRDKISSRCEPMGIEDLITQGEVRQKVPIVPGKFIPEFRSVSGEEDLLVKRMLSSERGSDTYILNLYSLMDLTLGLYALNGRVLPSHLDKDGNPDEDLFKTKLRTVRKLPLAMLIDLSVNYVWFGKRLQKLFVVDEIKGF